MQFSMKVRNVQAEAIAKTVGPSPYLEIRSGPPPADCRQADSGILLCAIALPETWMELPTAGSVSSIGEWKGEGVGEGKAAHYRIKNSAKSITHIQGTISATGGGGDMEIDNAVIAPGQTVRVTSYGIQMGNA